MRQGDVLQLATPEVMEPLLGTARYKAARGGRAGMKSHFFAELLIERFLMYPDTRWICAREIQKSLQFSSKALLQSKIAKFGVGDCFNVVKNEIRSTLGNGLILFEGMQNHNADSIKSLEDFDGCWFEEAGRASQRTLDILFPTIRKEGSEIWLSWNPDQPDDPVEQLMVHNTPANAIVVTTTYLDNPYCSQTIKDEAAAWQKRDPEGYQHVWLGGYNVKRDAQIIRNWIIDEFEPGPNWHGPYHGLDFGFANDPTAGVRCWVHERKLFVEFDAGKVNLELDETSQYLRALIPGIERHTIRCDNARPESISYLRRFGLPKAEAADKWPGSVEDGIAHLNSYDQIVIHPRCKNIQTEARLYSYKIDKLTGEVQPTIIDRNNHWWDAVRYALAPVIRRNSYNLDNIA